MQASANELAAVPVATGKATTGRSKSASNAAARRLVKGSLP